MIRLVQLGDIHIRNNVRHEEYKKVFEKLYKSLRENKPDAIIITGDLFHQKTELTGNSIVMASNFLRELATIAETFIIIGNHDYSKQNIDRIDSIRALMCIPAGLYSEVNKIWYSPKTYEHILRYGDDKEILVSFFAHSDIDQKKYDSIDYEYHSGINIAIYHGIVNGAKLDNGFELESEIGLDYFKKFDFAMLGDIHKQQHLGDPVDVVIEKEIDEEDLQKYKDEFGVVEIIN